MTENEVVACADVVFFLDLIEEILNLNSYYFLKHLNMKGVFNVHENQSAIISLVCYISNMLSNILNPMFRGKNRGEEINKALELCERKQILFTVDRRKWKAICGTYSKKTITIA